MQLESGDKVHKATVMINIFSQIGAHVINYTHQCVLFGSHQSPP